MNRRSFLLASAIGTAPLPSWLHAQASGLDQVALCVGNNSYRDAARLINAKNDAQLMHMTFSKLGARSEVQLDLDSVSLTKSLTDFARKIQGRDIGIAWFFFSGHGAALDGKSLLLGTDVSLQNPTALKSSGFDLDRLKGMLAQAKPRIAVVVIDACRNNPFQARGLDRPEKGIVPKRWDGTLVAYSTAEYTKALDWPHKANGPYATALSAALLDSHPRGLEEAFKVASDQVFVQTDRQQTPGYYSDLRSQVWVDSSRVSLRPLPSSQQNQYALAEDAKGSSRSMDAAYRADLQLDDRYVGTQATEWAKILFQLETGTPRLDRYEAAETLNRAQRKGADDRDLCAAGLLLEAGDRRQGVAKNRAQAAKLYERAAVKGYVPAQTLLGELSYERQDYVQAYKWLSVASRSGYGRAILDLAQLTGEGAGTVQDPQKAAQLLLESFKSLPGMTAPNK